MATHTDIVKDAFIDWLRYPSRQAIKDANALRVAQGLEPIPETVSAFAEKNGVRRETLQRWKADPEVKTAVMGEFQAFATVDDLAAIRDAMICKAKDGNVQAASLVLKAMGILSGSSKDAPGAPPPVDPAAVGKMSAAEIERRLAELEEE